MQEHSPHVQEYVPQHTQHVPQNVQEHASHMQADNVDRFAEISVIDAVLELNAVNIDSNAAAAVSRSINNRQDYNITTGDLVVHPRDGDDVLLRDAKDWMAGIGKGRCIEWNYQMVGPIDAHSKAVHSPQCGDSPSSSSSLSSSNDVSKSGATTTSGMTYLHTAAKGSGMISMSRGDPDSSIGESYKNCTHNRHVRLQGIGKSAIVESSTNSTS
eukprot:Lankesteria_metandrocarpae@DN7308_c0_g1_i1.p1